MTDAVGESPALLRFSCSLSVICLLVGCGIGPFPGGRLEGREASLSQYDRMALPESTVVLLETRPAKPYSVHVQLFRLAEGLYFDPAAERRWLQFIDEDDRVRIRFSGDPTVYRARAVRETDPEVLARFDDDLVILRVEID